MIIKFQLPKSLKNATSESTELGHGFQQTGHGFQQTGHGFQQTGHGFTQTVFLYMNEFKGSVWLYISWAENAIIANILRQTDSEQVQN